VWRVALLSDEYEHSEILFAIQSIPIFMDVEEIYKINYTTTQTLKSGVMCLILKPSWGFLENLVLEKVVSKVIAYRIEIKSNTPHFIRFISTLSTDLRIGLPSDLLPSRLSAKLLCLSSCNMLYMAHNFKRPRVYYYINLWRRIQMCNYLNFPVNSFFLDTYIFFITLFSLRAGNQPLRFLIN
jgi:hypothetical protein